MGSTGEKAGVGGATGALSGAAAGATLGTAVPGIGNIAGAIGGAVVGGLGGGALGFLSPGAPTPPTFAPTDPRLQAAQAAAQNDQINALMTQASGDSASLMARYGTRLALANSAGGSPLMMARAIPAIGKV